MSPANPPLSLQQATRLERALKTYPMSAHLVTQADSLPAKLLASHLDMIFTRAGWRTSFEVVRLIGLDPQGIMLFGGPSEVREWLRGAFAEAEISVSEHETLAWQSVAIGQMETDAVRVVVGAVSIL